MHFLPRSPFFQVVSAGCIILLVSVTLLSLSILYLLNWQVQLYYIYQVPENVTFQKRSEKAGFRKTWDTPKTSSWKHCKVRQYLTRHTDLVLSKFLLSVICISFLMLKANCSILLFSSSCGFLFTTSLALSPGLIIWCPVGMSPYTTVTQNCLLLFKGKGKMWMQTTSILYFIFSAYIQKVDRKAKQQTNTVNNSGAWKVL